MNLLQWFMGSALGFPEGIVLNGKIAQRVINIKGDKSGICEFSIPQKGHNADQIWISAPEYNLITIDLDSLPVGDLTIRVDLFCPIAELIPEGKVERLIILENRRKYIRVTSAQGKSEYSTVWIKTRKHWSKKKYLRKIKKYYPEYRISF